MVKIIFKIIAVLAVLVVLYLGIHFAIAYREIFVGDQQTIVSEKDDSNPVPSAENNRFDILVLGMRGDNDPDAGTLLTDTIMLISIDKMTSSVSMVSIPRDLYIDMNGIRGKLNEVYVRGLEKNQGLALASEIVSRITGVFVDKAVVFDFKAFSAIVDTLGGIDIYLPKPFIEKTQWGYEFSLLAGNNHLTGEQALYYVRSRYSTSDFDRARRQQEVMLAIKKKAIALGFLGNPVKITGLMSDLKGNLRTNIQLWELSDMLDLAKKIPIAKTSVLTTENLLYETHLDNGEYVLLPKGDDFKLIREYFKNVLTP